MKSKKRKKKGRWFRNLLFLVGFLSCMFPVVSNVIERQCQMDAVATYDQVMEKQDDEEIKENGVGRNNTMKYYFRQKEEQWKILQKKEKRTHMNNN